MDFKVRQLQHQLMYLVIPAALAWPGPAGATGFSASGQTTVYTAEKNDDPITGAVAAASPVALIPTLSTVYLDLKEHGNPWREPVARILDPKDLYLAANPATGNRDQVPGEVSERFPDGSAEAVMRIEDRYRRAGAKYLAGSGTTAFGTMPGISLHTELDLLTARVGLPPRQALAAATSNFGAIFGWKKMGQVKAGYNADLLVLDADPLADIHNLKQIDTVMLNGRILDREKLLSVVPSPAAAPGPH